MSKNPFRREHAHKYVPVGSQIELGLGIFTMTAFCQCGDFIAKVITVPVEVQAVEPTPAPEPVPTPEG